MLVQCIRFKQGDFKYPIRGKCVITSRASTDPAYRSELLLVSTYWPCTETGSEIGAEEEYVLRLKDGDWSLWYTDDDHITVEEMTKLDFILGPELYTQHPKLKASKIPWENDDGVHKYLSLDFGIGQTLSWTMYHRLEQSKGQTMEVTQCKKIPEAQQEGWLRWLAERAKVEFAGMKGCFER